MLLQALHARAKLLAEIRQFFAERQVLEVDTPILSIGGNPEPNIDSLQTYVMCAGSNSPQRYYLNTSPEFAMKRLLAMGAPSIYQVAKVFRDGETSRTHNPEFSMLEFYRLGFDHHQLMAEVADLLCCLLDVTKVKKVSYREVFESFFKCCPHSLSTTDLTSIVAQQVPNLKSTQPLEKGENFDLLFIHCIQPNLGDQGELVFVYDYPKSMAALSQLSGSHPQVAHRFEVFINGMELGNGFFELTDAGEQRQRFVEQNATRRGMQKPKVAVDELFLDALNQGLPSCAGIALGIERMLMIILEAQSIDLCMSFSIDHA